MSIKADIVVDGYSLTLLASHPVPPVNPSFYQARNAQLDEIAQLAKESDHAFVVVGDLSVTMWSDDYRRMMNDSGLRNARQGFGIVPTWPAFFLPLMIPLDHCLVSKEVFPLSVKTYDEIGSDHLPIIIHLGVSRE